MTRVVYCLTDLYKNQDDLPSFDDPTYASIWEKPAAENPSKSFRITRLLIFVNTDENTIIKM